MPPGYMLMVYPAYGNWIRYRSYSYVIRSRLLVISTTRFANRLAQIAQSTLIRGAGVNNTDIQLFDSQRIVDLLQSWQDSLQQFQDRLLVTLAEWGVNIEGVRTLSQVDTYQGFGSPAAASRR